MLRTLPSPALIDINNLGQVIATGVPEPHSYALMLASLILVGSMARRKRLPAQKYLETWSYWLPRLVLLGGALLGIY